MSEPTILHTNGRYTVRAESFKGRTGTRTIHKVYEDGCTAATCKGTYDLGIRGLAMAIAKCDELARKQEQAS